MRSGEGKRRNGERRGSKKKKNSEKKRDGKQGKERHKMMQVLWYKIKTTR